MILNTIQEQLVDQFIYMMKSFGDSYDAEEIRKEIIYEVQEHFCRHCQRLYKDEKDYCQCWDDE